MAEQSGTSSAGAPSPLGGALAALDIALWDLKGKMLGQPVYKLLGGALKTALPFYASIGGNGVSDGATAVAANTAGVAITTSLNSRPPATSTARQRVLFFIMPPMHFSRGHLIIRSARCQSIHPPRLKTV